MDLVSETADLDRDMVVKDESFPATIEGVHHVNAADSYTAEQNSRILRRVDSYLMPLM